MDQILRQFVDDLVTESKGALTKEQVIACWTKNIQGPVSSGILPASLDISERHIDTNGTYYPHEDSWYYGEIPAGCTREQLALIIARGVVKWQQDELKYTGIESPLSELIEMALDEWFKHDEDGENKFAHLIPEEESDDFFEDVRAIAQTL